MYNSYWSTHGPMKAKEAWKAREAFRSDPPLIEPHRQEDGDSIRKIPKYNSYRSIHEPMEAS